MFLKFKNFSLYYSIPLFVLLVVTNSIVSSIFFVGDWPDPINILVFAGFWFFEVILCFFIFLGIPLSLIFSKDNKKI